jgi:hypothetical protein
MANQDVLALQREINASGWRDPNGNTLVEDGLMGPRTMAAMQEYNSRAPSVGMGDLRAAEAQTPSGYGSNSRYGMDFGPLLQPIGGKPTQTPTGQTYVKPATPMTPSIPQRGATAPATEGYRDAGAAVSSPTYNQPMYAPSRSSGGGATRTNTTPAKPETKSSLPADYDPNEIARRVAVAEAIQAGQRTAKAQERSIQSNASSRGMGYSNAGYANLSDMANRLWAKVNEPTSYDVEGHPLYEAAKARAKRQSAEGSSQIVQQMAARNLGKSSITRDRVKGLEQELLERLETETVPLVQSQIAADRQSQINGLMNAYNAQLGAENFRRSGIESEMSNRLAMAKSEQAAEQFDTETQLKLMELQQKAAQAETEAERNAIKDQYQIELIKAQTQRALRPPVSQSGYTDQLLQSALQAIDSNQPLSAAQQAAFDRWMGAQAGVAGVTDNALFDEAGKRAMAEGFFPGDPEYSQRVNEIYLELRSNIGRTPARIPTTAPTTSVTPPTIDEIERKRRELGY